MRLVSVLIGGREVVPFDRFLTAMFGTDSATVARILNDMLLSGHATFEPHGDDLVLQITEAGEAWVAEQVRNDPGAIADVELDAELDERDD